LRSLGFDLLKTVEDKLSTAYLYLLASSIELEISYDKLPLVVSLLFLRFISTKS
jgi:hypothetical protein